MTLSEVELQGLRGINENVSLNEVADIYLPLSRLLNLYVGAAQELHRATNTFLGDPSARAPYVIGLAGSVAVGKSTTARILQALLARWPNHPKVGLVSTDGFLFPNEVLRERGIFHRKGFPESYDVRRLVQFMADLKSGKPEMAAPVYSHLAYDIIPGQLQALSNPDVVIVEGLNVLQSAPPAPDGRPRLFVADFFDFSVYVDAGEADIARWYVDRFLALRDTAFRDPSSYFHGYAALSAEEAQEVARRIWRETNEPNLRENIQPTRNRARLILEKASDHSVQGVRLRKL